MQPSPRPSPLRAQSERSKPLLASDANEAIIGAIREHSREVCRGIPSQLTGQVAHEQDQAMMPWEKAQDCQRQHGLRIAHANFSLHVKQHDMTHWSHASALCIKHKHSWRSHFVSSGMLSILSQALSRLSGLPRSAKPLTCTISCCMRCEHLACAP